MDILTILGSLSGSIITIITLLTTLVKPLREKFVSLIVKSSGTDTLSEKIETLTKLLEETIKENETQKNELFKQSEALQSSLRNEILCIYFNCRNKDEITSWERENVIHLFESYKKLNGNSFIEKCVEEILEIKVKM